MATARALWSADTRATRFVLALTSLLLAIGSIGTQDCGYLGCFDFSPITEWPIWTGGWLIYGVAGMWLCLRDRPSRLSWAVNALGVWLFWSRAIVTGIAYASISAASSTLALAAFWVYARTKTDASSE